MLDERADARYDVPIPDERFLVSYPVGARIFDRTATTTPFGGDILSDSLVTAERLGIVLAIHEVRRVDEDTVFVMSTSRASQKVIDRFGQIDSQRGGGDKVYGEFTWGSNGRRLPDHSVLNGMQQIRLARWKNDGIAYQWVILKKIEETDLWIGSDGSLPVGFYVHTRDEWQEALKSEGEKSWLRYQDVVTLDVPAEAEGLEAILSEVHEQTLAIFGSTTRQPPLLNLKSIPFRKQDIEKAVASGGSRSSAPQNISLDEWLKEVREMIAD
jgi:hypothetical protein